MRDIGIYVHIPFCKKKCKYCDFISFENSDDIQKYIESLKINIENISEILEENKIGKLPEDLRIDTIYFGGGTPSFIDSKYIGEILEKIASKFNVKKGTEITIEVNPGTVTYEKLDYYYKIGINRLSIGLQSTKNEILKTIGRIHTYEEFLETYKMAEDIRI